MQHPQQQPVRSPLRTAASFVAAALALSLLAMTAACSTAPESKADRALLTSDTSAFLSRARTTDPTLDRFFDNCAGYAVMPEIGKGGFILGGAYGKGQLFDRQGRLVGYCDVSQGSIGAQIGGQTFGEIIFFENDAALTRFKGDRFTLTAQASAVALASGAGAATKYADGVAVFIMNPKGLMLEASVGGQQFSYQALADASMPGD
jgi:lipid-binding SYLF domain-containing protein